MTVGQDLSDAAKKDWQAVADAAQELKDALDKAAHTSPADVVHGAEGGVSSAISTCHQATDNIINWVRNHAS